VREIINVIVDIVQEVVCVSLLASSIKTLLMTSDVIVKVMEIADLTIV
jgi:hypothetical protein